MGQIRANNEYYETHSLVTSDGAAVSTGNPLPVTLGSDSITITGDVNLVDTVSVTSTEEDPVHTHITEVGTSGILDVAYLPIGGEVSVSNLPALEEIAELYSFNNFGTFNHRGWTMSDVLIPMLSIRAKSSAASVVKLLEYELGNNNANSSTVGYVWLENATITGTVPSWTSLNTEAEYRFYTDNYGSNTPNGFTGGIKRHSGIIIGKNSSAEEELSSIALEANGVTLTLCVMRLDSATKLDLWFAATVGII